MFDDHKLLTQVAGHGNHTIKLLPSMTISDEDCEWIEQSFDAVIAGAHRTTGAVWKLGKTSWVTLFEHDPPLSCVLEFSLLRPAGALLRDC